MEAVEHGFIPEFVEDAEYTEWPAPEIMRLVGPGKMSCPDCNDTHMHWMPFVGTNTG
jgi:hypothetical protein